MEAGDIEDGFATRLLNKSTDGVVQARITNRKNDVKPNIESEVGWDKKVFVRTWGCAHNSSDSEYMAGLLASAGYSLVNDAQSADLVVLNSCTVKTPSENQLENEIAKARDNNKAVVVAGCVSQVSNRLFDLLFLGCSKFRLPQECLHCWSTTSRSDC